MRLEWSTRCKQPPLLASIGVLAGRVQDKQGSAKIGVCTVGPGGFNQRQFPVRRGYRSHYTRVVVSFEQCLRDYTTPEENRFRTRKGGIDIPPHLR